MGKAWALDNGQAGFCVSFAHAVQNYVIIHGGDTSSVMSAMGYSSSPLRMEKGERVTAAQLSAGLNAASLTLNDEHAGLRIGMSVRSAHWGALGYACMTAPNGISAMHLCEELQQLVMTEVAMRHKPEGALVIAQLEGLRKLPSDYHFWAFLLACRLNFIRGACGRHVRPEDVMLPCRPPRCQQVLRSFVGAPVDFHADIYVERLPGVCLQEPNPHGSPEIHGVMAAMARREWRDLSAAGDWMMSRLKMAIHQALERGANPTLHSLAPKISQAGESQGAFSARQLQRQLTGRQRSFRDVVSEVRRERALAQLRSTDRPLADIAAEAGYAELSSFHRAVRRWTGLTPMGIRKDGADRRPQQA